MSERARRVMRIAQIAYEDAVMAVEAAIDEHPSPVELRVAKPNDEIQAAEDRGFGDAVVLLREWLRRPDLASELERARTVERERSIEAQSKGEQVGGG